MRRLSLLSCLALGLVPLALPAQSGVLPAEAQVVAPVDAARISRLAAAMQLGPMLAVMREEGLARARDMDAAMLAGEGGVPFRAEVARLYDAAAARAEVEATFRAALADHPDLMGQIEAFYGSTLGQKAAALEVEARRAFLDPATREAAGVVWKDMQAARHPRVAQLTALVAGTDAIDENVKGQAKSGLAFYQGLRDGGGLRDPMTDAEVIRDLAARSDQARREAMDWLYPYLALAYEPLSDQELSDYAAFLTSDAGKALNRATFDAFDQVFVRISRGLGLAVSHQLAGQDI